MSVTDEVTAVVEEHGAAVHAAARSLVTAGADAFTLDVFRTVVAALEAGDRRPPTAIVRDAFVGASEAVRPPLPGERRLRAMRLLEQPGGRAPAWLLREFDRVGPDAPAGPAPEAPPPVVVDPAWIPDELTAAEAAKPAAAPAPAWGPTAEAPAAVTDFAPRRKQRRFHAGTLAALGALLLLLGAGAYALTRDDGTPTVPGPAAAQTTASVHRQPAQTAAERRAERRQARAARHRAADQRHTALKAHKKQTVRSFVAFVRRTKAARQQPATTTAPVTPARSAPAASAPATSAPAPAATSAPAPRATSAPPAQPPPSNDPPGRHAP